VHEVATFLPGRLEFEHELDHDAEDLVKDLEFGLVHQWDGDVIVEDEDDLDVRKRARWVEERRRGAEQGGSGAGPAPPVAPPPPPLPLPPPANGVARKSKDKDKEREREREREKERERDKDKSTADGEDDGEVDEETLPPIPSETDDSLAFKLTLLEMYHQRTERREESKQLMFSRGLLEYKKVRGVPLRRGGFGAHGRAQDASGG
jgi:transcriptional adapter 2-alpha